MVVMVLVVVVVVVVVVMVMVVVVMVMVKMMVRELASAPTEGRLQAPLLRGACKASPH